MSAPCIAGPFAGEVFYHLMPIAWRATADGKRSFGDFVGMAEGLPYLSELGITAIKMTPPYPSVAYHGYHHAEPTSIDPRLGTRHDFRRFVRAADGLGIKVYLDLVAYGISKDDARYQQSVGNPSSPYAHWFAFKDSACRDVLGYDYTTATGERVDFAHLDLRHADVRAAVGDWAASWLDDGVAGFRLDHVWQRYPCQPIERGSDPLERWLYAVAAPAGTDGFGYHLEPFWREFRDRLVRSNADVRLIAEQAEWHRHGEHLFGPFDAALGKPMMFAARRAIRDGRAAELAEALEGTTRAQQAGDLPGTFLATLGDHDVDRLATEIRADDVAGRAHAAAAVLMLQPYAPVIYAGDEIGMLGSKHSIETDASDIGRREPFKWLAAESGRPMSNYWAAGRYGREAKRRRFSRAHDGRSVEEQAGRAGSLLETYRAFIGLRQRTPALARGGYAPASVDHPAVWACWREADGERLLCLVNLSADRVRATMSDSDEGCVLRNLASSASPAEAEGQEVPISDGRATINLEGFGWVVHSVTPTNR
ncbi:MAG: alpha-amylase family glycosyl hydrolase [Planctomycetota bacterium]